MPLVHPRKYSKAVHKRIIDNLREGRPKRLAFRLSGVHPDTVWDWLRYGREDPERFPEYVRLAQDIDDAIAHAQAEALDLIKAAAKSHSKHWTAAAWYLERTDPEQFGRRDHVEVETGTRPLVQLNQLVLTDHDVREQSRAVLRAVAGALPRGDEGEDVIDLEEEEMEEDGA